MDVAPWRHKWLNWMGWDWIGWSLGGVRYGAPYGANNGE